MPKRFHFNLLAYTFEMSLRFLSCTRLFALIKTNVQRSVEARGGTKEPGVSTVAATATTTAATATKARAAGRKKFEIGVPGFRRQGTDDT